MSTNRPWSFLDFAKVVISLNGYYTWLHPYFPILPPPDSFPVFDRPIPWYTDTPDDSILSDASPLGLAISTLLSLIPPSDEEIHLRDDSIALRRGHAQMLAKRTSAAIESDSELPDSATTPANALLHERPNVIPRQPFHPQVPLELESPIALCILSVYEVRSLICRVLSLVHTLTCILVRSTWQPQEDAESRWTSFSSCDGPLVASRND